MLIISGVDHTDLLRQMGSLVVTRNADGSVAVDGKTWNTDVKSAPRGEDVLIAVRTLSGQGPALTQLGMLLWEPYDRDDDETDDDIEGYFGEHSGRMGVWYWNSTDDGCIDKRDIVAFRPLPAPFVQDGCQQPIPAP